MAEDSTIDRAAAKLAEAVRDMIRETPGLAEGTEDAANPGLWNVFFLLLLIANLAFLIYLIPANWIEGPHWELLGNAIPAVGGSLFVIVASWYKNWTLRITQMLAFRISQAVLSIVFVFSLWIPWLPIHPLVEPSDARVQVDDDPEWRMSKRIWLSMKPHSFIVRRTEWNGESGKNERKFRLTWRALLRAALWGEQPHWALCYKVMFKSETAGIKVRIVPDPNSRFDTEFLKQGLAEHSLQEGPDNSLIFSLPSSEATLGATQLPVGHYKVTPFKVGCKDGPFREASVGPASDKPASFVKLQCGQ